MSQAQEFYGSGRGDRLIDPRFFPKAIHEFVRGENELLETFSSTIDLLVEIGCMRGRYLDWAIRRRKRYMGLDVVKSYVESGQRIVAERGLPSDTYQFVLGGAEEISKLVHPNAQAADPEKCLLLFPFNSFGNMKDPVRVIEELARAKLSFLISSYRTDEVSTAVREKYYRNCGYCDLQRVVAERGICFLSNDGLWSIAYHQEYLTRIFAQRGIAIASIPFGQIGMAHASVLAHHFSGGE